MQTLKRPAIIIFAAFFSTILAITAAAETVAPFTDVGADSEYLRSIEFLHGQNILRGDDLTGDFRPLDGLNRAEFAAILMRLAGEEPSPGFYGDCFPDVTDEWYAPYICAAKEEGLVKGYEGGDMAGLYGPDRPLINAEVIVMMGRLAGWETEEGGEWYEPAWNYALSRKIIENAGWSSATVRGLMAEVIFRTAAVKFLGLGEYGSEDAAAMVAENKDVVQAIGYGGAANVMDVTLKPLEDRVLEPDAGMVPLFSFTARTDGGAAEIKGLRFYLEGVESTGNLARIYLADDRSGEDVFVRDLKLRTVESPFVMIFDEPLLVPEEGMASYTLYADFDYESGEPVQLKMQGPQDFNTGAQVAADFPLTGPRITRDPLFYDAGEDSGKMEMCASWDAEYNLPFPSQNGTLDYSKKQPGEAGAAVTPAEEAHLILPIDQGSRGICAAAAVYSSMRWLEDKLGKDFIENGKAGLDALIEALYKDVNNTDTQDEHLVEYLEGLNACIEVEYDTQAGGNVMCSELLEYKEKGCDIPLAFRCEALDPATGEVAKGASAEEWGHRVDLADVVVDSGDSDKCTVTFANSWSDPKNPGKDLDGLGAGRYEKAVYNDDDESFDIESPWADYYRCKLRAAAYICVDEDEC